MSKWKTYRADDFCLTVTDGTHDSPKPQPSGRYLITSKHLKSFEIDFSSANKITEEDYNKIIQRSKVEQYDILFSMIGTIGNIHRVTIPNVDFAVKNMGIFKMGGDAAKSLWMYYWLQSPEAKKYINSRITGSTQGYLTLKNLRDFPVCVPPLETQKRIADILSAIDDKIELNRRITTNLEQQAQALYKSWFVDFEPFGGKMPEDWRVGTISNIVDLLNGFAFKSSDFVEKGLYKLITIKGVQDGNMSLDGADCLDIIPPQMPQWCKLKKEDILLSLTGNVGRCCLVDTENCLLNQRVAKLHPKEEYNRLFVYALFRQEDMKARMISIARGTAQMNLSPIETGKLPLIIPSNEVLKDFGNRFNNIIHTLTNNIVESSYLAQLRDTLLPKLMSGEIKV
ncbi:MAG: restriction endonuclease subunit S [Paludibacteraceae bacterium]|nr:restriction endonuclease subunit S [Paludibacteraceae bacterium]